MYQGRLDGVQPVAVKVLQRECVREKDVRAFMNEAAILHSCRHPHVVLMIGACLDQVMSACSAASADACLLSRYTCECSMCSTEEQISGLRSQIRSWFATCAGLVSGACCAWGAMLCILLHPAQPSGDTAWTALGLPQEQELCLVQELLFTDLFHAISDVHQASALTWRRRYDLAHSQALNHTSLHMTTSPVLHQHWLSTCPSMPVPHKLTSKSACRLDLRQPSVCVGCNQPMT